MPADRGILGYLLMDAAARRWYDAASGLWIDLSYIEDGREVADYLPPPSALRPELAPARKEAAALARDGVDVRPVRARVLC